MTRIVRIEVDQDDDCIFFFDDSDEPFSSTEFNRNTATRTTLEILEYAIYQYNKN